MENFSKDFNFILKHTKMINNLCKEYKKDDPPDEVTYKTWWIKACAKDIITMADRIYKKTQNENQNQSKNNPLDKIAKILTELKTPFKTVFDNELEIEDIGGSIYYIKDKNEFRFIHGNKEIPIKPSDPDLKEIVAYYIYGYDEFDKFIQQRTK